MIIEAAHRLQSLRVYGAQVALSAEARPQVDVDIDPASVGTTAQFVDTKHLGHLLKFHEELKNWDAFAKEHAERIARLVKQKGPPL